MLALNNFAENLMDVCPESILFSAVQKLDVDFVTSLAKQKTENLCSVYEWISKLANVEDFFCKFIYQHVKRKKYQKLNY